MRRGKEKINILAITFSVLLRLLRQDAIHGLARMGKLVSWQTQPIGFPLVGIQGNPTVVAMHYVLQLAYKDTDSFTVICDSAPGMFAQVPLQWSLGNIFG